MKDIKKEIKKLKWFHNFEVMPGVWTNGVDETLRKLEALHLPENLTGKTVLDIGAYDGFFSFECERRGAQVTACDSVIWDAPGSDAWKCFKLLCDFYKSGVEIWKLPVEELHPLGEPFDIVLFMGVLYHSKNPYFYLEKVTSMVKDLLILETLVDCLDVNRPAAAFYPQGSLNNDSSTHWGLNTLAIVEILKELGFKKIDVFDPWDMDTAWRLQTGHKWHMNARSNGRQVFHCYK